MQYPLTIEGFESHQLVIETGGFFGGSQLLMDGQPARRGSLPGQFTLRRDDGVEVKVELRHPLLDPVPVVHVNDKPIYIVEPFSMGQRMLAALSLVVVLILSVGGLMMVMHKLPSGTLLQIMGVVSMVICGLLGALAGFVSMIINGRVVRSEMSHSARLFMIGALSIAVVITYLIVFILLMGILSLFEGLGGQGHASVLINAWMA